MPSNQSFIALLACIALSVLTPAAHAVKTSHWISTTEADFKKGTFKNVVATNLGDLKLSREVKTLLSEDSRVSAVYALAQSKDGTIYAATGPQGILLSIKDGKVATVAELGDETNLLSLLIDAQGRLLIGTGGEAGRILRIDKPGEKPHEIFKASGVHYIWAMMQSPDATIYVATGPTGKLFALKPDGSSKVLLDTDENNLLCMASDGKDFLYVGTDPNGLVLRVNRTSGEMFVLYDAPENEISSLVHDAKGDLYVATADATQAEQPETETGAAEEIGRPEGGGATIPIPSSPPSAPKPPDLPKPSPGEPLPIPKASATRPLSMSILTTVAAARLEETDSMTADLPSTEETDDADSKPVSIPAKPGGDSSEAAPTTGNAVYRIDPEGFVTEVFRVEASIFALQPEANGDALLVATGGEGNVYRFDPTTEETVVLAKVDPKDVMCLLPSKDGGVVMGLANQGEVAALSPGFAPSGTYTSPVLDASQISAFGKVHLVGSLPESTKLTIATRSGNVEESSAAGWSDWSAESAAVEFLPIGSPSARFLQYRLSFASENGKQTPVVGEIDAAYQVPNRAPQIKSIKITSAGDSTDADESASSSASDQSATNDGKVTIAWTATDPNEDELEYSLSFRDAPSHPWILLKDKLKDQTFDWQTRGVADGRYEIKVQASDAAGNPVGQGKVASRVSDPIVVDNTPPLIGDVSTAIGADGEVTIRCKVVDRTSTVAGLQYSVDSSKDWQAVLPSDKIADSPEEAYELKLTGLKPGAHQIMLRASDSRSNRAYQSVSITTP